MDVRLDHRPRLVRAARLRLDAQTKGYILLSPERGLLLNESATEIVLRCTGELTVQEIADTLFRASSAEEGVSRDRVLEDVLHLIAALHRRNLLFFEVL